MNRIEPFKEPIEEDVDFEGSDNLDLNIPQLDGNMMVAKANLAVNDGYQIGVFYPCDECDSKFSHENVMLEHKRKKHNVNRTKRKKKGRP